MAHPHGIQGNFLVMPSWLLEFLAQTIDSVNCVTDIGNATERAQQGAGCITTTKDTNLQELPSPQLQDQDEHFEADDDNMNEGDARARQPKQVVPQIVYSPMKTYGKKWLKSM